MLLQRLRDYSDFDRPPTMYDRMRIKWLIALDRQGRFLGFVRTESEGKRGERGKEFFAPHIGKTSGVEARLLAENAEYVLGIARDRQKQARARRCHEAFVKRVRDCGVATTEPSVNAVLRFLEGLDLDKLPLPEGFKPGDNVTFQVDGVLPMHLKPVEEYWASTAAKSREDEAKPGEGLMECLVCGEYRKPVRRLQFKIKGIPGGQGSGVALISANEQAFESYGLEESLIAPTCADCGERFSKAANALISGERTHIRIGPLVYLFWAKEDRGFSVASLLSRPEPEEVRALLSSAFSGARSAAEIDATPFYATALSANPGRAVVRDWLDTTVAQVKRNLRKYFVLQSIVDRDGTEGRPLGLYALAASTVRDASKELPPDVAKALLRTALGGGPLPSGLLFQAVKRIRAEQAITRARAALIKMVLLSQLPTLVREDAMVQLDPQNQEPAYLCGRLLAVLEAVQRAAIPGAKATITDRFFGTASSAPASVFGRLIRGSQPHLARLRKERRATYEALQRRLEEVQSGLPSFPKILTLQDQGLFGLGYYHQRAADRAAAIAHKQSRESGADASGTEPTE